MPRSPSLSRLGGEGRDRRHDLAAILVALVGRIVPIIVAIHPVIGSGGKSRNAYFDLTFSLIPTAEHRPRR